MRAQFVLAIIFLFGINVFSQDKKDAEYIVLNHGDTIYGDVRLIIKIGFDTKYHDKVGFKLPGKESKHYTASEIKAYRRKDFYCESAKVESKPDKVFLYRVIDGPINYYLSSESSYSSPMIYSPTTGTYMGGGTNPEPSLFIKKDKDFIEVVRKNFADVIKENFLDCDYFADGVVEKKFKLKGRKYGHKDIESLVELYNMKCKDISTKK